MREKSKQINRIIIFTYHCEVEIRNEVSEVGQAHLLVHLGEVPPLVGRGHDLKHNKQWCQLLAETVLQSLGRTFRPALPKKSLAGFLD